jgi:hypothetical protein
VVVLGWDNTDVRDREDTQASSKRCNVQIKIAKGGESGNTVVNNVAEIFSYASNYKPPKITRIGVPSNIQYEQFQRHSASTPVSSSNLVSCVSEHSAESVPLHFLLY